MVPTMRPSPKTSILAPTRCGVEPVVDTIVTSAAGSPRSSASATAAKTSWFISLDYTGRDGQEGREGQEGGSFQPISPNSELMNKALFRGLGSCCEGLGKGLRAMWRGEFAAGGADLGESDALGHIEANAG